MKTTKRCQQPGRMPNIPVPSLATVAAGTARDQGPSSRAPAHAVVSARLSLGDKRPLATCNDSALASTLHYNPTYSSSIPEGPDVEYCRSSFRTALHPVPPMSQSELMASNSPRPTSCDSSQTHRWRVAPQLMTPASLRPGAPSTSASRLDPTI